MSFNKSRRLKHDADNDSLPETPTTVHHSDSNDDDDETTDRKVRHYVTRWWRHTEWQTGKLCLSIPVEWTSRDVQTGHFLGAGGALPVVPYRGEEKNTPAHTVSAYAPPFSIPEVFIRRWIDSVVGREIFDRRRYLFAWTYHIPYHKPYHVRLIKTWQNARNTIIVRNGIKELDKRILDNSVCTCVCTCLDVTKQWPRQEETDQPASAEVKLSVTIYFWDNRLYSLRVSLIMFLLFPYAVITLRWYLRTVTWIFIIHSTTC